MIRDVERCAKCGLDVGRWRVVVGGAVYCRAFCAATALDALQPAATTFTCQQCGAITRTPLTDRWRIEGRGLGTCAICCGAAERSAGPSGLNSPGGVESGPQIRDGRHTR